MAPPRSRMAAGVVSQLDVLRSNSPSACSARYIALRSGARRPWRRPSPSCWSPVCSPCAHPAWCWSVAETAPRIWAFRRAIAEDVRACCLIAADDIWLAAGALHLLQRPQAGRVCLQPGLHVGPGEAAVTVHVLLKAGLQHSEQFFLLGGE